MCISFTEFIAGQPADLLDPRNRGVSSVKRDSGLNIQGILRIKLRLCNEHSRLWHLAA